jgi:hypothetical protein
MRTFAAIVILSASLALIVATLAGSHVSPAPVTPSTQAATDATVLDV